MATKARITEQQLRKELRDIKSSREYQRLSNCSNVSDRRRLEAMNLRILEINKLLGSIIPKPKTSSVTSVVEKQTEPTKKTALPKKVELAKKTEPTKIPKKAEPVKKIEPSKKVEPAKEIEISKKMDNIYSSDDSLEDFGISDDSEDLEDFEKILEENL